MSMTSHIGISTISKQTKNSTRSIAEKVPITPVSITSSSAISDRVRPTRGVIFNEYRQHRNTSSAVSTISGIEIESTPTWKRTPSEGIHGTFVTACSGRTPSPSTSSSRFVDANQPPLGQSNSAPISTSPEITEPYSAASRSPTEAGTAHNAAAASKGSARIPSRIAFMN